MTQLETVLSKLHRALPDHVTPFALVGIVFSFILQLAVVSHASDFLSAHKPWLAALPIRFFAYPVDDLPLAYKLAFGGIALLETLLLGIFLLATYRRRWRAIDTFISVIASVAIAAFALTSSVMTSGDMYAYIGDSLLGPRLAYAPPASQLGAGYAIIHHIWGRPLLPAAYGPLWLWWNTLILGLGTSLHAKLFLLRLINVFALGVTLRSLLALSIPPYLIAATAVNPSIVFYYITNGHNDLLMIALLLSAMTCAGRSPVCSGFIAGAVASMKLALVVPAAAIAVVISALPRRFAFIAVMLLSAIAFGVVLGGSPYVHALSVISTDYSRTNELARVRIPHIVVALSASMLTALAIIKRRIYKVMAFAFASLTQALYPWYTIWGLPYAAARSDVLATLLVAFPIVTAILENEINSMFIGPLVFMTVLLALVATLRKRRKPVIVCH